MHGASFSNGTVAGAAQLIAGRALSRLRKKGLVAAAGA